jgi:hypothetical protein
MGDRDESPDGQTLAFADRLRAVSRLVAEHGPPPDAMSPDSGERLGRGRRTTVRQCLALVAVVAVLLGARRAWLERAYRAERAAYHQDMELLHGGGWPQHMVGEDAALHAILMPRRRELVPYHRRIRQKWERAASYPWRPVDPDPPGPG